MYRGLREFSLGTEWGGSYEFELGFPWDRVSGKVRPFLHWDTWGPPSVPNHQPVENGAFSEDHPKGMCSRGHEDLPRFYIPKQEREGGRRTTGAGQGWPGGEESSKRAKSFQNRS